MKYRFKTFKNYDSLIHVFFLICIAFLVAGLLFLLKEVRGIKDFRPESIREIIVNGSPIPSPTPEIVTKTVTNTKYVTPPPKTIKTTAYLNLNGNYVTQNTDWTDITSTDITFDIVKDYGGSAYVDWSVAIKTSDSASITYVRLFDVTHGSAVGASELSTSNTDGTSVASGRIYPLGGLNTYRVQIRSLTGAEATFEGGRIKIVY